MSLHFIQSSLNSSTRYYYVVGSNKSSVMSRQFSFRTPPDSNPDAGVNIIAFGGIITLTTSINFKYISFKDMGFGHVDHTNAYTHYLENPSLNTSRLILNQVNVGKGDIVLHIGKYFCELRYFFIAC